MLGEARTSRVAPLLIAVFYFFVISTVHYTRAALPTAVNALLTAASIFVVVAVHEVLRAGVARFVGLGVPAIAIGTGRPCRRFMLGTTELWLHAYPAPGATSMTSPSRRFLRVRLLLTAILPLAFSYAALTAGRGWTPMSLLLVFRIAPGATFEFANLFGLVAAGIAFMRILFATEPDLDRVVISHTLVEATRKAMGGAPGEAVALLRPALAKQVPQDLTHVLRSALSTALLFDRQYADALAMMREDLTKVLPASLRAPTRNNAAWAAVMLFDPALLGEADEWSAWALENDPSPRTRGTRGAVLLMRGRPEEALPLLEHAYEGDPKPRSRARSACALAVAHAQLDRPDRARTYLAEARRLEPSCELLAWATREITREVPAGYRATLSV